VHALQKNERRNIIGNTVGEGLWGLGWNMAAPLTVLPILIRSLGGGSFEVGVLAALLSAGALLPQLLGSLILQTGSGKKRFLVWFHVFAVAPPWLLMGLVMLFLSDSRPVLARFLLIGLISFSVFAIGFIIPVWLDWVAGIFRKKIRGLAFGLSNSASAAGGTAAALVAAYVTGRLPSPTSYTVLFLIAFVILLCSMFVFSFIRITGAPPPPTLSVRDIFGRFKSSLSSINFRRYLVARSFVAFGAASVSFFAVHYLSEDGGEVSSQTVIGLGALIMVSQALFSTLMGRLGDRIGHRVGVMIGVAAQSISILIVVLAPGPVSCGIAFSLAGIGFAAAVVSHHNFLFETCPHDSRTAHITVANLVLAPVMTFAPLAVGKAIELFGTVAVFGVCLIPTALGFLWLAGLVRDPGTLSPAETEA
jgi:MFS family permease